MVSYHKEQLNEAQINMWGTRDVVNNCSSTFVIYLYFVT